MFDRQNRRAAETQKRTIRCRGALVLPSCFGYRLLLVPDSHACGTLLGDCEPRTNESWRGLCPQANSITVAITSQSRRPVAKVFRSRAERRCCVSAQRASSSHSLAQRAREIATKPSFRPNGSAVHVQCAPNGRPVGPQNIFLFACLALQARLLERMALWAGNAVEWSPEFFSAKQRDQRLLSRCERWLVALSRFTWLRFWQ